jgi:hypothetical protein
MLNGRRGVPGATRHPALGWVVVFVLACGCMARPVQPLIPPNDASVWRDSLNDLAAALFAALKAGRLQPVLVKRAELDRLLTLDGQMVVAREREEQALSLSLAGTARAWATSTYQGFCAQEAHAERGGSAYGLRSDAWVVQRILVVARRGKGRTAAWVEGRFFYSDRGWLALSVGRIEPPRGHHTDLEVAPCDVERGIH